MKPDKSKVKGEVAIKVAYVNFRLYEEERRRLKEKAAREGISIQAVLTQFLTRWLNGELEYKP